MSRLTTYLPQTVLASQGLILLFVGTLALFNPIAFMPPNPASDPSTLFQDLEPTILGFGYAHRVSLRLKNPD